MRINRPAHDAPAEHVENDCTVHFALTRRVFSDVRDPELVAVLTRKLPLHTILGGGDVGHASVSRPA